MLFNFLILTDELYVIFYKKYIKNFILWIYSLFGVRFRRRRVGLREVGKVGKRGDPGIEPGTSCTLNKNHTTRPIARSIHLSINFYFKDLLSSNTITI